MEDEKFKKLQEDIQILQERLFHHSDETARPIIDKFIEENPVLLTIHDREWYYTHL